MKFKRKPGSIRTRIAGGFVLLLLLVFVIVGVSFNLIVNAYIETQATRQLGVAADKVTRDILNDKRGPFYRSQSVPKVMQDINNSVRRATFFTQVQAMLVDGDCGYVLSDQASSKSTDAETQTDSVEFDEKQAVFSAIKQNEIDISSTAMQQLSHAGRNYYIMTIPWEVKETSASSSTQESTEETLIYRLVLYLDMTDVTMLATTINRMLVVIIFIATVLAAALSLVMSDRLTRPIQALSQFAAAIGRSDFSRREFPTIRDRELVELSDTMNRTAEQLESYDKEQKTFFQNASHELRTPLMSIKGYAEGISVGVFDDNTEAAGIIVSESDHLTHMVEDLLYLSKIDNITQSNEVTVFDVRELLSNCGESLRGIAIHEGKRIEYDFPEDSVLVTGSEYPLERAFVNIISNGLRYAKSSVRVYCAQVDKKTVVRIEDDGQGIDPNELPHIFDRFYKGKGGKHGIGLSISKAVISQHKGSIRAENTDHGAVFAIEIPE